jgi:hypothetical protein
MQFDELVQSLLREAKEAPEGKHYTSRGSLKTGDADADGDGGPKYRSDPTYKNPNESEEGGPIKVETQMLNHRGGVTARSYSQFDSLEEFEKVLPRLKMIYQRILVNGEEIEAAEEDAERVDKDRMKCNSPRRTSGGSKKFVVKACKNGKEKIVRYGDPNMKIKKSNPKRRKSFRARHKCDQKKDKFSAGYWSCKKW